MMNMRMKADFAKLPSSSRTRVLVIAKSTLDETGDLNAHAQLLASLEEQARLMLTEDELAREFDFVTTYLSGQDAAKNCRELVRANAS